MTAETVRRDADDRLHDVAFYRDDGELIDVAVQRFSRALRRGNTVLVIATEAHRQAFRSGLAHSIDVRAALAEERLTMLDAAATLAGFMVDGVPDADRFDATVGNLIRRTERHGRAITGFGEMVALLWEEGRQQAALQLEQLWENLQERHSFSLFCAYPSELVLTEDSPDGYVAIAAAHNAVVGGPPVAADAEVTRHFPAHPGSPRLARAFVRTTLANWGLSALGDQAALVVSELATNAVRHVRSDFAVSLVRSGDGLRVAVGDTTAAFAASEQVDQDRSGGRGLDLVAASARDWGHHPLDNGKLVWAELDTAIFGESR